MWIGNLIHTQSILHSVNNTSLLESPESACQTWVIKNLRGQHEKVDDTFFEYHCTQWFLTELGEASPVHSLMLTFFYGLVIIGILLEGIEKLFPRRHKSLTRDNIAVERAHDVGLALLIEGLFFELVDSLGGLNFLSEPYKHPEISNCLAHLTKDQGDHLTLIISLTGAALQTIPFLVIILWSSQTRYNRSGVESTPQQRMGSE